MEARNRIRWWRGRSSKVFLGLRFKQTRMQIGDRGNSLRDGTWSAGEIHEDGLGVNHLIFRTLSVENSQEELAVSVLTFGELESGKDLSERWGCRLKIERNRQASGDAEGKRERQTCSRTLQEESARCWGWWTVEVMAEGREGVMGEEE